MTLDIFISRFGFWFSWLLIPILFELLPAFFYYILLRFKKPKKLEPLKFFPYITVIIPVYNSEETLYDCLSSINDSTYPHDKIQLLVVNNGSKDNSFGEFHRAQMTFLTLNMRWLQSDQGKAKALNTSIYNAQGQYILNIDSDGILDKHALVNMITKFESERDFDALTGTILINKKLIKQTKKSLLRFLQDNEYFEYAQAFLAGRRIESDKNQLFTLSGAFSAFRKETLFKTFMYDPTTVGEDVHMTFQIREIIKGKVGICSDAIFYAEPISGLGELYLQRQRWQRGEIEAVQNFMKKVDLKHIFNNFLIRRMLLDHTFIFCRIVWIFGLVVLLYLGYSATFLGLSLVALYALYVLYSLLSLDISLKYLKAFPEERSFLRKKAWIIFTLPLYNFVCALIRLLGIINAITHQANWYVTSFGKEWSTVKKIVSSDIKSSRKEKP